jgi:hypothetical protein
MAAPANAIYGAIEAGGTKFVCAAGSGPDDLSTPIRIATTTPAETLEKVVEFFRLEMKKRPLRAAGIGSFGPLYLRFLLVIRFIALFNSSNSRRSFSGSSSFKDSILVARVSKTGFDAAWFLNK